MQSCIASRQYEERECETGGVGEKVNFRNRLLGGRSTRRFRGAEGGWVFKSGAGT